MIKMEQINKVYRPHSNPVHALRDVSLHIEMGDFVAVMGPSGSGKSTLMNVMGCLDTPSSGSYWLGGVEVSSMNSDQLATVRNRKIGFVFQNYNLLPRMTALRNVELPMLYAGVDKEERKTRALDCIGRVGMLDRIDHRPSELSGGQCQRIAIARALVNNPDIILADEPTGNLDSVTSMEIMNIFRSLHQEHTTIVLVTHEEDIAAFARRVLHFRDGKLINDELPSSPHIKPSAVKGGEDI
ncbi:MAG: ABC transporter ATP-binding protein [Syntrophomonadaceae bacterium]|nr:ABC transporter ATP-binding protein [Syntrophomonadaceae bacterium]NLX01667.1 ABC transporter ATP-binding protein [Syntrophomonadaceae bacterium]